MRILAWNCRGAGRAPTVRTISALSYSEGPDVLFLVETKIASPKLESLNRRLGFSRFFGVDCIVKAGGLALFWKHGVDLKVIFSNNNVIATLVYFDPLETTWLLIAIHGPPCLVKQEKF
jgi:exonuclease III